MGYREICTNDVYIYNTGTYLWVCVKKQALSKVDIYVYMICIYIYLHIHMYSLVALSQI